MSKETPPLQLLIPTAITGAVIGKHGSHVKIIQEKSRADCQFHRGERNDQTRVVVIRGTLDQCIKAQRLICIKIAEEKDQLGLDKNSTTPIPLKMLIPNALVSRFVGRNGAYLRKLVQDCPASFAITRDADLPKDAIDRIITITGSIDDTSDTCRMIYARILDVFDQDPAHSPIQPSSRMSPPPRSQPILGLDSRERPFPLSRIAEPPLTLERFISEVYGSYEKYLRDPERDAVERAWVQKNLEIRRLIERELIERELMERELLERELLERQRAERELLERERAERERLDRDRAERERERERERSRREKERERERHRDRDDRESKYLEKKRDRESSSRAFDNMPIEVVHVMVPSSVIGSVIGKGGSYIKVVENASGAKIRAKPDREIEKGARSRPVFVVGNGASQWKAQQMLYGKILDSGGRMLSATGQSLFDVEVFVTPDDASSLLAQNGMKLGEVAGLSFSHIVGPREDSKRPGKKGFHITGTFFAVQVAQQMIRDLLNKK